MEKGIRRTLWISSDLWTRIGVAAKLDGRSSSSWIRRVVEKAIIAESYGLRDGGNGGGKNKTLTK